MDMFRHQDERVNLKSRLAAVAVQSVQENPGMVLDDEKSSTLPG